MASRAEHNVNPRPLAHRSAPPRCRAAFVVGPELLVQVSQKNEVQEPLSLVALAIGWGSSAIQPWIDERAEAA